MGCPAVDPETATIYINANDIAWTGALTENAGQNSGRGIYLSQCGTCHGEKLAGTPPTFPSLVGIGDRLNPNQIAATIKTGKGRMPGFPNLSEDQVFAIVDFVTSGESKELESSGPPPAAMKYRLTGYRKFLDPDGYPAVAPPWGTLNAINLNTGEYAWKIPLGEYPELTAQGIKNTGIVTKGGLLFIGATNFDRKFRAFDKATGELLWETTLPFSANTTPATYSANGRQFVVIAAGGGKDHKSASGGIYVAFALAENNPSPAADSGKSH
jgi:quinoprotein glucose dehydrogenase